MEEEWREWRRLEATFTEQATLCRLLFSVEEATVARLVDDGCFEDPQNDINKGLKVKTGRPHNL